MMTGCSPGKKRYAAINFLVPLLAVATALVLLEILRKRQASANEQELIAIFHGSNIQLSGGHATHVSDSHVQSLADEFIFAELVLEAL